jgi:glutathione S-transferase
MADNTYTLYYWTACKGFTGRCTPLLWILLEKDAKYEVKDKDAWDGSPIFACPIGKLPGGLQISQTPLLASTIGKQLGLAPKSHVDTIKADQICLDGADFAAESFDKKAVGDRLAKWLKHFEALITASSSDYLVGDGLSYADFMCLMGLGGILKASPDAFTAFPGLTKWAKLMSATKGVKALEKLGVPQMPAKK